MSSLPIWLDGARACGYLPDRQARSGFVHPSVAMTPQLYSQLIALASAAAAITFTNPIAHPAKPAYRPGCRSRRSSRTASKSVAASGTPTPAA